MFVCTSAEWAPRASSKVSLFEVFRRVFFISTATLVLLSTIGCQKPKGVQFAHSGLVIGRVLDASSSSPIGGVSLSETPLHVAISDPQGAFSLPLPEGPATVLVSAVGYRALEVQLVVTAGRVMFATKDGYLRLVAIGP